MSTLQASRHAAATASQRRAHLSLRAMLLGVFGVASCLARAAFVLRAKLDPRGGAFDVELTRLRA